MWFFTRHAEKKLLPVLDTIFRACAHLNEIFRNKCHGLAEECFSVHCLSEMCSQFLSTRFTLVWSLIDLLYRPGIHYHTGISFTLVLHNYDKTLHINWFSNIRSCSTCNSNLKFASTNFSCCVFILMNYRQFCCARLYLCCLCILENKTEPLFFSAHL